MRVSHIGTCFAFAILAATSLAAEPSPKLKQLMEKSEELRKERLADLAAELEVAKTELESRQTGAVVKTIKKTSRITRQGKITHRFPDRETKDKAISESEEAVAELEITIEMFKNAKIVLPRIPYGKIKVGDVGLITDDEKKPLLVEIQQIIDGKNMLVRCPDHSLLWLKLTTTGFVDGKILKLNSSFEVASTKTYQTALGSKTVFYLVPFNLPE